jgi:hypothetical protein
MEYGTLILVHVICAIIWGGGIIFMGFYLIPSVLESGPAAGPVMGGIMVKRKLPVMMSAVGILAVLTGLRLYALRFSAAWVLTPEGIALTLGGLLALSALAIGFFKQRVLAEKMAKMAQEGRGAEIPPVAAALGRTARVVAWHVIAVIVLMAGHHIAALL